VPAGAGTDAIKVDPPEGDMVRHGPPFRGGISTNFASMNYGKRSIVLDLQMMPGREAAYEGTPSEIALAARAICPGVRVSIDRVKRHPHFARRFQREQRSHWPKSDDREL